MQDGREGITDVRIKEDVRMKKRKNISMRLE